jgi:hypothetical protein
VQPQTSKLAPASAPLFELTILPSPTRSHLLRVTNEVSHVALTLQGHKLKARGCCATCTSSQLQVSAVGVMQLMTPFLHQLDQPRVWTPISKIDRAQPCKLAGQVLRGPPSAFWKRSSSAAETVLGLEKLLRKLVCHCTFVRVRCEIYNCHCMVC